MLNITQTQLTNATAKELRDLQDRIASVLNHHFEKAINDVKAQLYVGATVRTNNNSRKSSGKIFTVEKINPKNVICRENGTNIRWNITASLLELV